MFAPSRRISLLSVFVIAGLIAPSVPAFGATFDSPMVARVSVEAHRARPPATTPPTFSDVDLLVAEVVRLTNVERAAVGRPALTAHPAVMAAAMAHSADQAAMGRLSHLGSDGSDTGTRLTRAGFTWRTWGENVAAGQTTAADVVGAWMASSVHRANILNGSFVVIGVGIATGADGTRYWTMDLAA